MNINVRLNKNFTTAFNKMQETYGEEFAVRRLCTVCPCWHLNLS